MLRVSLSIPVYLMHIVILQFWPYATSRSSWNQKYGRDNAKIQAFKSKKTDFIVGNGWDQNDGR
jgi:hypothetical protein